MGDVKAWSVKQDLCPDCGHFWEIALEKDGRGAPRAGDLSACFGCGRPLRLQPDPDVEGQFMMVPLTEADVDALDPADASGLALLLLEIMLIRTKMKQQGHDPDSGGTSCGRKH